MIDVSVIIPAYNAASTIKDTINSVLSQDEQNFEIIVINNGSTDETVEIVSRMIASDSRISLVQSRVGRSRARNMGLRLAEGTYIQFLDADDLLHAQKLSRAISYLRRHPEIFAYVCSAEYYWVEKHCLKKVSTPIIEDRGLLDGNPFPIETVLFRNQNIVSFNTNLEFNEDWLFWCENLIDKRLYIQKSEFDVRVNIGKGNTMGDFEAMFVSQLYVRSILKNRFPTRNLKSWVRDITRCSVLRFIPTRRFSWMITEISRGGLKAEFHIGSFLAKMPLLSQFCKKRLEYYKQLSRYVDID